LSLQIIGDNTSHDHEKHNFAYLFLEIDARMRMAELGKHVGDINAALEDFQNVQRLCERFPTNN